MTKKETLISEVAHFSNNLFAHRDHFVCVYGSYASDHYTDRSDMDMFVALKEYTVTDFEKFRDFFIDLHVRHGLTLDDEVPYENKLLVSFEDVEHAVSLHGLHKNDLGHYVVPAVIKSTEFLASLEIRWRLLFNALTTPAVLVHGDAVRYGVYRERAEKALVMLAHELSLKESPSVEDLVRALTTSAQGEEGEMFLGYKKEREAVIAYIRSTLKKNSTK